MQSELPWNVAGIPPEAREAARAAARREGLSVGEWMTRRIMRGFPDAMEERSEWRRPVLVEAPAGMQDPGYPARESEEMLARVSRSETEAQNAYKALDQQLHAVARRLETAEQNQTENNRAMSQAAAQINVAAREQAQAFEQMTSNVTALAERLARVERHVQTDGTRDAVKALHEGLSRVADQIAQTANQSAAQIAALAGNVDSLATHLAETRQTTEATAQAVETRFASIDERLRVVERTAFSCADALDHTMENVETLRASKEAVESEVRQQSAEVAHIREHFAQLNAQLSSAENAQRDYFEQLNSQLSSSDNAHADKLARMEASVADLQAQQSDLDRRHAELQAQQAENPFDHRLESIEHVLSDIMGRLEQTERANVTTSGTVEQTLRELALGFETADRHNRENVRELQSALQDTADKIAAVEERLLARIEIAVQPKAPEQPQPSPEPAHPILDTPIFPEHVAPQAPLEFGQQPTDNFQPFAEEMDRFVPPPFASTDQNPGALEEPPLASGVAAENNAPESFLNAARRSAKAAAAQAQEGAASSKNGLGWTFANSRHTEASGGQKKRYLLAGSIFGIAVAGALAGVVLTHGTSSPTPHAPPTAAVSSPFAARPSLAPAKSSDEVPPQQQAPAQKENESAAAAAQGNQAAPATITQDTEPSPTQLSRLSAPAPKRMASIAQPTAAAPGAGVPATAQPAPPLEHLVSLARSGDSSSQLLLGLHYLEGSGIAMNEAEAARWLGRAAQQGQPLAQYRLGTLYERGRGVPASARQAVHWYELAAKQGNRKAMHNLAVAFAEGSGEPKDPAQAALWFSRAASLGLADSQFNLAVLYERGMGVKQSLADAYKWYLIAAAQGDAESKTRSEALSTQLSDADRAAAQQAAASFKPQPLNPAANTVPTFG